jgi:proton-dependent oligopeptide transporter, POT family
VRTRTNLSLIFAVAAAAAVVAFFVVLFVYRDPERERATSAPPRPRKSLRRIFADMVVVLRNPRFVLFLVVSSGFFFIYNQVYNLLPKYLEKAVESEPPMDLYTLANPLVIVCFQLLVTRLFGKMKPVRSMLVGAVIVTVAMLINIVPLYLGGGLRGRVLGLPAASLFVVATVSLIAFGELFTSARMYEYIGALAPPGQEGLFLGYANLPLAIGAFLGGIGAPLVLNWVMLRHAQPGPGKLLELDPAHATLGWLILMSAGLASAGGLWLFDRWLGRHKTAAAA